MLAEIVVHRRGDVDGEGAEFAQRVREVEIHFEAGSPGFDQVTDGIVVGVALSRVRVRIPGAEHLPGVREDVGLGKKPLATRCSDIGCAARGHRCRCHDRPGRHDRGLAGSQLVQGIGPLRTLREELARDLVDEVLRAPG